MNKIISIRLYLLESFNSEETIAILVWKQISSKLFKN